MLEPVTEARRLRGLGQGMTSSSSVSTNTTASTSKSVSFTGTASSGDSGSASKPALARVATRSMMISAGNDAPADEAQQQLQSQQQQQHQSDNQSDAGTASVSGVSSGDSDRATTRSVQNRLEQLAQKQRFLEESKALDEVDEMYAYGVQRFGALHLTFLLACRVC